MAAGQPMITGGTNEADNSETHLFSGARLNTFDVFNRTNGDGIRGGSSQGRGVVGTCNSGPEISAAGVVGYAFTTNGNGVIASANLGPRAYALWAESSSGLAGLFDGHVQVNGQVFKSGGGFIIDHPVDPENKYLRHSFVESPDALNVYSGNATTDEDGNATVALPEYFEELNEGFHYQLTVIGEFAHAVVAEEVKDNQFAIKTDRPNVRVSWQVTGVRKDAFAKMAGMKIEEEKPPEERGTYLHPEAFQQPETRGAAYARREALRLAQPEAPEGQAGGS